EIDLPQEVPSGRRAHGHPHWPATRSRPGHSGADKADAAQGFATYSWNGSFGPKEKLRQGTYASPKSSLACRNHREIRTFGTLEGNWHGVVTSQSGVCPGSPDLRRSKNWFGWP